MAAKESVNHPLSAEWHEDLVSLLSPVNHYSKSLCRKQYHKNSYGIKIEITIFNHEKSLSLLKARAISQLNDMSI
ncbi:hypothetical protein [Xenorhabdus sp. SGI246]|uniref:hypothetical protein n=1 Tax=Xenorhabdus sp. SGI246 TaxID=3158263 RepID=UPI00349FCDA3